MVVPVLPSGRLAPFRGVLWDPLHLMRSLLDQRLLLADRDSSIIVEHLHLRVFFNLNGCAG